MKIARKAGDVGFNVLRQRRPCVEDYDGNLFVVIKKKGDGFILLWTGKSPAYTTSWGELPVVGAAGERRLGEFT